MFKSLIPTLAAFLGAVTSSNAFSQDLNAMNAEFNARMNAQMQASTTSIIEQNMNNPHVQQQYQIYLQQGGTLDLTSYCYRYAETGGFTQDGFRRAMQTQAQIHAKDQASMNAYHRHSEQLRQETAAYRNAIHDKWARQRGENLSAQATFVNNADGTSWQLPTNVSPGQIVQDRSSGNYFCMDIHGQYWMSNGQGWWQPVNYQQ